LPASHKIKIAKLQTDDCSESQRSMWSVLSPKTEAQALLKLLGPNGTTVEAIRELIAIPAETEELFRSYAARHPEDDSPIVRVIEFRRRVGEEFERLIVTL